LKAAAPTANSRRAKRMAQVLTQLATAKSALLVKSPGADF
jgi:hypothetical protein